MPVSHKKLSRGIRVKVGCVFGFGGVSFLLLLFLRCARGADGVVAGGRIKLLLWVEAGRGGAACLLLGSQPLQGS